MELGPPAGGLFVIWILELVVYNITMLSLEEMLFRLAVAVALGALVGLEREFIGKEAGFRTDIMVAAGAAIFSIVSITLPYIIAVSPANLPDVIARNSGFLGLIANIVVGIGFLGAGIIVKQGTHVHGLTTAATVWFAAAIGVLCGVGLITFALISTVALTLLLSLLRNVHIPVHKGEEK
ncbi:MAG: MgtC family protein [Candidatus Jorgensenbacteria bacterium GW2011_GWA2_45_13]|uniref:MgtC family protein n=1 Tax=Candidatus Jorgensenbacteria bacterium GW2011_GWA2_45_13 TaxID=1618662 RepID=A0A0G1L4E7_9BACT|nr:MAG: MgtC family protein [Candidatus Jorgensenbacteria bacterium GW2011_GWA2_45_13]